MPGCTRPTQRHRTLVQPGRSPGTGGTHTGEGGCAGRAAESSEGSESPRERRFRGRSWRPGTGRGWRSPAGQGRDTAGDSWGRDSEPEAPGCGSVPPAAAEGRRGRAARGSWDHRPRPGEGAVLPRSRGCPAGPRGEPERRVRLQRAPPGASGPSGSGPDRRGPAPSVSLRRPQGPVPSATPVLPLRPPAPLRSPAAAPLSLRSKMAARPARPPAATWQSRARCAQAPSPPGCRARTTAPGVLCAKDRACSVRATGPTAGREGGRGGSVRGGELHVKQQECIVAVGTP